MGFQRLVDRWRWDTKQLLFDAFSYSCSSDVAVVLLMSYADIIVPAKQLVARFAIDPETEQFDAANALWDKIDEAFDDVDNDL